MLLQRQIVKALGRQIDIEDLGGKNMPSQIFIPYPGYQCLSTLPYTGLYHYHGGIQVVVIT